MSNDQITAKPFAKGPSKAEVYHVLQAGKEMGPMSFRELAQKVAAGEVRPGDLIKEGDGSWTEAAELDALQEHLRRAFQRESLCDIDSGGGWLPGTPLIIGGSVLLFVLAFVGAWFVFFRQDKEVAARPTAERKDAAYFVHLGNASSNNKEYDKALQEFDEAIKLDPNFAPAYFGRGLVSCQKRDFDNAIKDYLIAVRLDPRDLGARADAGYALAFHERASAAFGKNDPTSAIRHYEMAIRLDPGKPISHHMCGRARRLLKDYDRAIKDQDQALRLDLNHAAAWNSRGFAWSARRDFDRAIRDFDEAIRLQPNQAGAIYNRGNAWLAKKDYDRAIRDFDAVVDFEPKSARGYFKRGVAWLARKDYDKALSNFDAAILVDANLALGFNQRGLAWAGKKDYDRAIKDFDEAIHIDPTFAIAYDNRGDVWSARMDQERAAQEHAEADRIDPPCQVRLKPRSNRVGNVQGTANNTSGKPIDGLTLLVKTAKWEKIFEVDVQLRGNDAQPFWISVGEQIDIDSCKAIRQAPAGRPEWDRES